MTIRLLQLNILQGKFLDKVIDFIGKSNIDIINLQEVSTGEMSQGGKYIYPRDSHFDTSRANDKFKGINCYEKLKNDLDMDGMYQVNNCLVGDPKSCIGNATLINKKFKIESSETIWLKDYFEIDKDFTDIPSLSKAAMIIRLKTPLELSIINTHLTWGPDPYDKPYKIEQAKKLLQALARINKPFIFSGDFNVVPETQTASMFAKIGISLTKKYDIKNTLNPRTHPAKKLFPKGLAVDYIFVSRDVKIKKFQVIDSVDLSDHYGLLLEFEI